MHKAITLTTSLSKTGNLTSSVWFLLICLAFAFQPSSSQAAIVAYWPWSNSVLEVTGNANPDGLLKPNTSPPVFTTTASPYGGSHALDATPTDSRFRVPFQDAVQIGSGADFTLSFWIRPDAGGSNANARIFDTRGTGSGGTAAGLQIKIDETHPSGWTFNNLFIDNGSSGIALPTAGTGFSDGSWHHIGVTYDSVAEQMRFFVDGAPESALVSTAAVGNFDGGKDLSLGAEIYATNVLIPEAAGRSQKYTGLLDELAIFDEVLSDLTIAELAGGTVLPSEFLPVPEPSSAFLLILGVLGMATHLRRRKQ